MRRRGRAAYAIERRSSLETETLRIALRAGFPNVKREATKLRADNGPVFDTFERIEKPR
jgi:hypothetical protein